MVGVSWCDEVGGVGEVSASLRFVRRECVCSYPSARRPGPKARRRGLGEGRSSRRQGLMGFSFVTCFVFFLFSFFFGEGNSVVHTQAPRSFSRLAINSYLQAVRAILNRWTFRIPRRRRRRPNLQPSPQRRRRSLPPPRPPLPRIGRRWWCPTYSSLKPRPAPQHARARSTRHSSGDAGVTRRHHRRRCRYRYRRHERGSDVVCDVGSPARRARELCVARMKRKREVFFCRDIIS